MEPSGSPWGRYPLCLRLRLALGQNLGSHLEICNNAFEQRVPVLYNDGCIEPLALNSGICCTDSKAVRISIFVEPSKKQAVTVGLTPVAIIAHIEKNIEILKEELVYDSQNRLLNLRVMGRAFPLPFFMTNW